MDEIDNKQGADITPMMKQYYEIKKEHQDKVLFFRLGDFYEMFNDDAVEISKLLNLTLTHRGKAPMCGIPFHAAKNYIKRLLEEGRKIAICEQINLSDNPRKLADRKVVQIYTPATVVDDEYLDSLSSSYIMALNLDRTGLLMAVSDVTTGEFRIRRIPLAECYRKIEDILYSTSPKEILVPDDLYFEDRKLREILDRQSAIITKLPVWYFSAKDGAKEAEAQFTPLVLENNSIDRKDSILTVVGALLSYIKDMLKCDLPQLRGIEWEMDEKFLYLNASTIKSLELLRNQNDGSEKMSLYKAIDYTKTSAGSRMLKDEILHPLSDLEKIEERQRWIGRYVDSPKELERVRNLLAGVSDLERLSIKASMLKTTPRDLVAISDSISLFVEMVSENRDYLEFLDKDERLSLDVLVDVALEIGKAINRECTNILNSGTIINRGYDSELDGMTDYLEHSSDILDAYLERVKSETGITIMKAGENRIIGYYLEVSKTQQSKVPESFIRKQTLVGAERYTTSELEEIQQRIYDAKEKSALKELELYRELQKKVRDVYEDIEKVGRVLSRLDFHSSLASLAIDRRYSRPEMVESGDLEIVDGRHPVVEIHMERNEYVPNSFSSKDGRFALITGPNMAGKSTYLRQIALIAILAHMGSYVPAASARIPLMDKLFCRVGASDNLARGESTFLVEMSESAEILRSATSRSLVIMDEIGRGTSTQDGMSLAYAIMNYLKKLSPVTLFATHYHELTGFDTYGMQLLTLLVEESKGSVIFRRKAVKGVAASSYGIHVAKLAGIPKEVIKDATLFQKRHFASYDVITDEQGDLFIDQDAKAEDDGKNEIVSMIEDYDLDNSTPMSAFMFLMELKKKLEE